jgi:hypothetical protein
MKHKALVRRLQISCLGLDRIDPLCLLVDDVIAALAQQEPVKYSDYEPDGVHHNKPPQQEQKLIGTVGDLFDDRVIAHRKLDRDLLVYIKEKNT